MRPPHLLITGMHRSGTSAVAGLVDRLGCCFGPADQRVDPHDCNEKGFYERKDVVALNDRILGGCGAQWYQPHRFAWGLLDKELRRGLGFEISELLRGLGDANPWYIKDPRLCLTFSLWREALAHSLVLFTVRNPLEIARSLARRGDCGVPTGLALWEVYTHRLLDQLGDVPVELVQYEEVVARPRDVARRLEARLRDAGFAGWPRPEGGDDWIQADLRHQVEDDRAFAAYATPDQVKLYAALRGGWPVDRSALSSWAERNRETLEEFEQFTHYVRLQRDEAAGAVRAVREERDEARRHIFRIGELLQAPSSAAPKAEAVRSPLSWRSILRPVLALSSAARAERDEAARLCTLPPRQPLPRVCAMVPVHDEIRMVGPCLDHLIALGCHVHVFCDRSPPEVVAEAEQRLGRGVVAVEQRKGSTCFDLTALLREAEAFANRADYDWFLRCDVDEFRLPERPDESLPAFAARVEAAGFNAVNFRELVFIPTHEQPDHDHPRFRETMLRYYVFAPKPLFRCQLWKKPAGPLDLVSNAGHRVSFEGMQVYPHEPPMCHYLYLSRDHFLKKYAARTYPPEELEKGWHGWRQRISDVEVQLPREAELHLYDPSRPCAVDASRPRTTPFLRLP
jgi:hypothetical protein